jgi:hypothetical protein
MNDLATIGRSVEAERYPGLLAWLEQARAAGIDPDLSYAARWLYEEPLARGTGSRELFEQYLELGETGAAQYLARKHELSKDRDRMLRRRSQLAQQLANARLDAHDALVQLKEAKPDDGRRFAEQIERIETDPIQFRFRPGYALDKIRSIIEQLGTAITRERDELIDRAEKLLASSRDNSDVDLAVRRIKELINTPEGLATAARLLRVAQRANEGSLSQDDIRLLYSSTNDGVRLIRTWQEMYAIAGHVSGPMGLVELLSEEAFVSELRLPSEFDRDKLRDLLTALSDRGGVIKTQTVADRLGGFLNLSFERVEDQRNAYGTNFPFYIEAARHRELSGEHRKLYLSVPLRGTDPSALSQLYRTIASADGSTALPILLYPGIADGSRALSQQMGISASELLMLDCIDLLRIAEVPIAQRLVALQQVLLPRMPSLGRRTYQTGGPVASELFRGRQGIIDELTSPGGKTVLFSGRMMGKSSVLSRIRDRIAASPEDEAGVCVLLSAATGELLDPLVNRLIELLPDRDRGTTRDEWKRLAESPKDKPAERDDKNRGKLRLLRRVIETLCARARLIILIDEADNFAKRDSGKDRELSLAWLLRDLENHDQKRLRIVFAGFQTLHHEVIAANGAFANWFGQLQLGPLERDEAISLIKEPLADFGVQFVSDAGIERILEFSGGYPLLIQEVCSRLMEQAMARRPPQIKPSDEVVTLRAGDVELVCRDEALRTRLHQVLSLNLDEYPRLKLVTYLILQAGMYSPSGVDPGQADAFTLENVQSMLVEWYGDKLSEYFSESSLPGLIEELQSLGLIAGGKDGGYRFLNRTFAGMLRDNPNFDIELLNLLEQVATPPQDREARRYWSLPQEHLDTLLRSNSHTLLVGLPATLKSQIVQTLFSRDGKGSSLLLDGGDIVDAESLSTGLRKQLGETRKALSLAALCEKNQIDTLVLDCPALPQEELYAIAKELRDGGAGRLVATGDAEVVRRFVEKPLPDFELVSLRRLRPQDIQAWGMQPYPGRAGKELTLIMGQHTAHSLIEATGGYFPLLQQFRADCERQERRNTELLPKETDVEQFRRSLTQQQIYEALLTPLTDLERDILVRLLQLAIEMDADNPRLLRDWALETVFEDARDDADLNARHNAIDVLIHLDLITALPDTYVFDAHGLLSSALGLGHDPH